MKLNDLLAEVDYISIAGDRETEVEAVVYDSRKAVCGALFVCISGQFQDGSDYILSAVQAGARVIVVERWTDVLEKTPGEVTVVMVRDARAALAQIAAAWFGYPAGKLVTIGLTGTKGKTTTAHMIKKILEMAGKKVGMIGTMGAFVGAEKIPVKNTTPESYELHALFARMLEEGCGYVVCEVSSQGLKQERTRGIVFDYGAFLNISPDHIGEGEHADFEEYLACKKKLCEQTKHTVVNIEDPHWQEMLQERSVEGLVTVSAKGEADLYASRIENLWEPGFLGATFHMSGLVEGEMALGMPGRFNVENALVAAAITAGLGIDTDCIRQGLREVSVKGRTQVLQCAAHISTFLIDYAHNALSMESLLQMLRSYHPDRLICLFGAGGNKPKQRRYDMGSMAGKYADLTILTTDNPRYETVEQINAAIIEGLDAYGGTYQVIKDREEAIHYLLDHCGSRDIVAFIGKGHEEYQEIQGVKYYFSEEEVVESYVKERKLAPLMQAQGIK